MAVKVFRLWLLFANDVHWPRRCCRYSLLMKWKRCCMEIVCYYYIWYVVTRVEPSVKHSCVSDFHLLVSLSSLFASAFLFVFTFSCWLFFLFLSIHRPIFLLCFFFVFLHVPLFSLFSFCSLSFWISFIFSLPLICLIYIFFFSVFIYSFIVQFSFPYCVLLSSSYIFLPLFLFLLISSSSFLPSFDFSIICSSYLVPSVYLFSRLFICLCLRFSYLQGNHNIQYWKRNTNCIPHETRLNKYYRLVRKPANNLPISFSPSSPLYAWNNWKITQQHFMLKKLWNNYYAISIYIKSNKYTWRPMRIFINVFSERKLFRIKFVEKNEMLNSVRTGAPVRRLG